MGKVHAAVGLVVRRTISLLFVVLLVLSVEFLFFRVGIGEDGYRGPYSGPVPEQLHFGDNIVVQYFYYLADMLTGGGVFDVYSARAHVAVSEAIGHSLPWTLFLFGSALVLSLVLGILVAHLISRTKNRNGRLIGQSSMLVLWSLPVILVATFFLIQVMFRFAFDWLSPQAGQVKQSLFPIFALTICSFGGFALIALQGLRKTQSLSSKVAPEQGSHPTSIARGVVSVMPNMKLNIAFVMTMAIVLEPFWNLRGLGFQTFAGSLDFDLPLVEASVFLILLIVLVSGFILDLIFSLMALRSSSVQQQTTSSMAAVDVPDSGTGSQSEMGGRGLIAEVKQFSSKYVRSKSGLAAGVVLIAFVILALVGPEVAGPIQQSVLANPDPVSAFLSGARNSVLFTFGVLALSLVVGFGVALLVLPLGRFNYPVVLLADCFLAFPIFGMILMLSIVNTGIRSGLWIAILATVLVTWAVVALSVLSRTKDVAARQTLVKSKSGRAARYRNLMAAGFRGALPDVLASLKYVMVIALLSIIAFDYSLSFSRDLESWGGMLNYGLQNDKLFNFDLWWILPLIGVIVLVSSIYIVLQISQDILEKEPRQERPLAPASEQPVR